MSSSPTVLRSVSVGDAALDHLDRGQAAAGEDEGVGEAARGLLLLVDAVVDHDRLQEEEAVIGEQLRAAGEELVEVLPADRLDHLDRDELVVAATQVAVVLQQHRDSVLHAGIGDAPQRALALLARDRGRRHAAAVSRGGVGGEAAPAGADLQQMVLGPQLQGAADALEPRLLGLAERGIGAGEPGARVHHRLVQVEGEEVVAEVVVGRDVAAGVALAVAGHPPQRLLERLQHGHEAPPPRVQRGQVAAGDSGQRHRVVRVPDAVAIGLAHADAAAEHGAVEGGGVDLDRGAQLLARVAEGEAPAVGLDQLETAAPDSRQGGEGDPPRGP